MQSLSLKPLLLAASVALSALSAPAHSATAEAIYEQAKQAYEAKDYQKALQYLEQAAEQGHARAKRVLRRLDAEGK